MNTGPLRGVCLFIYTTIGEATFVGSNRLHVGIRCILGGGVGIIQKLVEYGGRGRLGGQGCGWLAPPGGLWLPCSVWCLLHPSGVCFVADNSRNYRYINSLFTLFWNKPYKFINHQNSWKLSDKTPNFLFGDQLHVLSCRVVMVVNYHQQ
jgi:hypothetical protein